MTIPDTIKALEAVITCAVLDNKNGLVRQPGWLPNKSRKTFRVLPFSAEVVRKLKFPNNSNEREVLILADPAQKASLRGAMKRLGWKRVKKYWKRAEFLYGMDAFETFSQAGMMITACYKLACRSTLHGEWIPLDKLINDDVLRHREKDANDLYVLEPLYDIPWRLAKCVFTERGFSENDVNIIERNRSMLDDDTFVSFVEKIFFGFTPVLLELLKQKKYEIVIDACFGFHDY